MWGIGTNPLVSLPDQNRSRRILSGAPRTRADYERIDPKGKAFLRPVQWRRQPNLVSEEFPFTLITGRVGDA